MGDLTKNKPFETEVRFSISNIDKFKDKVSELDCELVKEYSFTDYYYKPNDGIWNSLEKSLRIREWHKPKKPTIIYLTKQEIKQQGKFLFKRSIYKEGKRKLYSGNLSDCRELLADLSFEEVYLVNKLQGWVWKQETFGLEFCAENTDVLGWTGEMEIDGSNLEEVSKTIERHQKYLNISDQQLSFKPLAVMIEEKLNL